MSYIRCDWRTVRVRQREYLHRCISDTSQSATPFPVTRKLRTTRHTRCTLLSHSFTVFILAKCPLASRADQAIGTACDAADTAAPGPRALSRPALSEENKTHTTCAPLCICCLSVFLVVGRVVDDRRTDFWCAHGHLARRPVDLGDGPLA